METKVVQLFEEFLFCVVLEKNVFEQIGVGNPFDCNVSLILLNSDFLLLSLLMIFSALEYKVQAMLTFWEKG